MMMNNPSDLGTPDYMAPEIWGGDKYYGAPVDMW
jgi:serine/threonine protein kinase